MRCRHSKNSKSSLGSESVSQEPGALKGKRGKRREVSRKLNSDLCSSLSDAVPHQSPLSSRASRRNTSVRMSSRRGAHVSEGEGGGGKGRLTSAQTWTCSIVLSLESNRHRLPPKVRRRGANSWPDIASPFAPVELVPRFGDLSRSSCCT